MSGKRVVVAMSGGVDSSVAAGLLTQAGYEVLGVTMRLWTAENGDASRHHKRCCSVEDTDDARGAADVLGVRHYVLNLEKEFSAGVVDHFVREYAMGRTPRSRIPRTSVLSPPAITAPSSVNAFPPARVRSSIRPERTSASTAAFRTSRSASGGVFPRAAEPSRSMS